MGGSSEQKGCEVVTVLLQVYTEVPLSFQSCSFYSPSLTCTQLHAFPPTPHPSHTHTHTHTHTQALIYRAHPLPDRPQPRDFLGGSGVKTLLPKQGVWIQPLVRELDPTCLD